MTTSIRTKAPLSIFSTAHGNPSPTPPLHRKWLVMPAPHHHLPLFNPVGQDGPPNPYNNQTPPYNPAHDRPPTPTTPPAAANDTPPLSSGAQQLQEDINNSGLPNPPTPQFHHPRRGPPYQVPPGSLTRPLPIKHPSGRPRRGRQRSPGSPGRQPTRHSRSHSPVPSSDDNAMDTQHQYHTRSKRRHPSTTEEDLTDVVRSHRQSARRGTPKTSRLHALQLAMHKQHSLQVTEAQGCPAPVRLNPSSNSSFSWPPLGGWRPLRT